MLEFIVLGEVPGTQFQITFNLLLALVALVSGAALPASKGYRSMLRRKLASGKNKKLASKHLPA